MTTNYFNSLSSKYNVLWKWAKGKGGNLEKQRGCKIWYTTLWSTNLCTKKFFYFPILSVSSYCKVNW